MCIYDIHASLSNIKNCVLLCYRNQKHVEKTVKSILSQETHILLHKILKCYFCYILTILGAYHAGKKKEDIKNIQNTIWTMYKDYLSDHDMEAYNRKMGELSKEYRDKGDMQLLSFCQNLLISWAPVINAFAKEFKKGVDEA